MTGWVLDELAHAGVEHFDPDHVARYDTKAGVDAADEVEALRRLGLGPESTLVDLGAGTGIVALAAAEQCRRVIAVDVSPLMLARLRESLRARDLTNVEVVEAGFLTYEHEGPQADFVYSRNALHHLPDFWKGVALSRIAALLRPGGILRLRDIVYRFGPSDAHEHLEAWMADAAATAEQGWTRTELEDHIRDEHSTFTWLLEPMIERAGLQIREADYSGNGIFARYVCAKR